MSNAKTRNNDATLSANESVSFEKVLFAHDPNTIPITSLETDMACRGWRGRGKTPPILMLVPANRGCQEYYYEI